MGRRLPEGVLLMPTVRSAQRTETAVEDNAARSLAEPLTAGVAVAVGAGAGAVDSPGPAGGAATRLLVQPSAGQAPFHTVSWSFPSR